MAKIPIKTPVIERHTDTCRVGQPPQALQADLKLEIVLPHFVSHKALQFSLEYPPLPLLGKCICGGKREHKYLLKLCLLRLSIP